MGISAVVAAVADAVTTVTVADVLTGAAVGGLVSGVTGGNILQGAAMGGLGGALTDIGGSLYNSATGAGAAGGTGINLANAPSGGPGIDFSNVTAGGAGIPANAFGQGVGQLGGVLGGATGMGATGIGSSAIPTPSLDASTGGGATGTTTGGVAGTAPNLNTALQGANIGATGTPNVSGGGGGALSGAPAPTAVSGANAPIDTATTGGGFNYTPGQATDTTIGGAGTVSGGATGGDVVSGTGNGAGVNLGTVSDTGGGGGFNYNPTQATTGATTSPYSLAPQGSTQGVLGATTIGGETPASSTLDTITGGLKKAGSSILDSAQKNIVPLGMLAYTAANKPAIPPQLNNVSQNAQLAGTTGTNLINASTSGTITPGQQSSLNMWRQQAMAQVKDYYGRQGLSGSSMEASAMNNVEQQVMTQTQAIIQQNLTQGLSALGASNTGNTAVANAVLTSNNQVSDMMARLAAATGSSAGQLPNKTP